MPFSSPGALDPTALDSTNRGLHISLYPTFSYSTSGGGGYGSELALSSNGYGVTEPWPEPTGSWTFELFYTPTSDDGTVDYAAMVNHANYPNDGWQIFKVGTNIFRVQMQDNVGGAHSADLTIGGRTHIVLQWDSGSSTMNVWQGGSRAASLNFTYAAGVAAAFGIACSSHNSGKFDEMRYSKVLRYTTNAATITVPTSPFTDDGNNYALWHLDGQGFTSAYTTLSS